MTGVLETIETLGVVESSERRSVSICCTDVRRLDLVHAVRSSSYHLPFPASSEPQNRPTLLPFLFFPPSPPPPPRISIHPRYYVFTELVGVSLSSNSCPVEKGHIGWSIRSVVCSLFVPSFFYSSRFPCFMSSSSIFDHWNPGFEDLDLLPFEPPSKLLPSVPNPSQAPIQLPPRPYPCVIIVGGTPSIVVGPNFSIRYRSNSHDTRSIRVTMAVNQSRASPMPSSLFSRF
ncbi:hypothetical protein QBC35DRAFT_23851 [Podospora australis]|uniref:Uncharacterized protein n=1 Tax=Podospora australis TaxID=1536484 RepID=A0AAN6WZP9_9PEZI|nr:hypothetical protein QBC35DRAFT_23851 [Podospora australis]